MQETYERACWLLLLLPSCLVRREGVGNLDPGEGRRTTILRSSPNRRAISGIAALVLRYFEIIEKVEGD